MNKKQYIMPKDRVVELGLEGLLLEGVVSGGQGGGGGLDTTPKDPDEGEEMVKQQSVWGNEW